MTGVTGWLTKLCDGSNEAVIENKRKKFALLMIYTLHAVDFHSYFIIIICHGYRYELSGKEWKKKRFCSINGATI